MKSKTEKIDDAGKALLQEINEPEHAKEPQIGIAHV